MSYSNAVAPWAQEADQLLQELGVSPEQGLSRQEARSRLKSVGPNQLDPPPPTSRLRILIRQFKGVLVALLATASIISFAIGDWVEALAVVSVLIINALIGFLTELRAARSMEALRNLQGSRMIVRRDGRQQAINTKKLVPGDIVIVDAGDRIGADLRILSAVQLQADESSLTGESVPVEKSPETLSKEAFVGDRSCMLHSGTTITSGSGEALVVATATNAEVGKIAELVASQPTDETTPLERRLDSLGKTLVWLTLAIASLVAVMGIAVGKDPTLIIETAIALAIASVPEGLPIVATMILGRGVHRMARRQALVQRLAAVETLGATGLICTDKTGTLTENQMHVDKIVTSEGEVAADDPAARRALELAALCNHAELGTGGSESTGDPMEVALLRAASEQGIGRDRKIEREIAFDPQIRMMATMHRADDGFLVAVKGAPEAVIAVSSRSTAREMWLARAEDMARDGLRVIAVATRSASSLDVNPYQELDVVALIGIVDPPRADVAQAIASCRSAGIAVCMMTGDHPETARQIASRVGIARPDARVDVLTGEELAALDWDDAASSQRIANTLVFARVSPEQKLQLVEFHQGRGTTVAMTGDGVNDAPALRRANIGIAMGQRGTEVAREASDMVLLDDAFPTLVAAVKEGRGIFQNIRSFVIYLLSCNLSEILVVGLATAAQAPLPLLPLQILFLNLVTDVFPALALGVTETDPAVMRDAPRKPGQAILEKTEWRKIIAYALLITASVLVAFFAALWIGHMSPTGAVTVAFLTLALAQLWHVFNMRRLGRGISPVVRNLYVWGAIALCLGLLALVVYWHPAARLLTLQPLSPAQLLFCVGLSLVPLVAGVLWRMVVARTPTSNRVRHYENRSRDKPVTT